jgi:hypothetical protein
MTTAPAVTSATSASPSWHDLTDRCRIEDAISTLGRCLDERDFDALRDLFTPDATVTTPGGTASGHEALVDQARRRHTTDEGIQHLITNILITRQDDFATARANLLVCFAHSGAADQLPFLLGEVYRFELRRTVAGWRIATMTSTPTWSLNRPANLQTRPAADKAAPPR